MPSKSKEQHKFMAAVANDAEFAKKAGVPQKVGREYMKADKKGKKYMGGGKTYHKPKKYRHGGGIDGCAVRGKTRGMMR